MLISNITGEKRITVEYFYSGETNGFFLFPFFVSTRQGVRKTKNKSQKQWKQKQPNRNHHYLLNVNYFFFLFKIGKKQRIDWMNEWMNNVYITNFYTLRVCVWCIMVLPPYVDRLLIQKCERNNQTKRIKSIIHEFIVWFCRKNFLFSFFTICIREQKRETVKTEIEKKNKQTKNSIDEIHSRLYNE